MDDLKQSDTRCTARRKSGQPCRNWAIKGATVCRMHGGSAPQVKRAAAVRLLMAADSVAGELVRIALSKTASDATKVQAIVAILDRAGLGARQQIDLEMEIGVKQDPFLALLESVLIGPGETDDLSEYVPPAADPNVIDAEVVEDRPALERARESEMSEGERNEHRREKFLEQKRSEDAAERRPRPRPQYDITEDPRTRLPVRDPAAERDKEYERFLTQRMADPPKRYQRRTQRSQG